jgi:hypothetical protein
VDRRRDPLGRIPTLLEADGAVVLPHPLEADGFTVRCLGMCRYGLLAFV